MRKVAKQAARARRSWRGRVAIALVHSILSWACTVRELPSNARNEEECCGGRGMCLPPAFLEAKDATLLGAEACSSGMLCVPDALRGRAAPKSCRVRGTASEGRCLPACLPSVAQRGAGLSSDGCEEHQRCVPCYDPITGESTDACSVAGDVGASEPPVTFGQCCGDLGRCVPQEVVSNEERSMLGRDSCSGEGGLCAPLEALVEGDAFVPASCATLGFGAEGRCLPACLPPVALRRDRLGQAGCASGHLCAPCVDPITGAGTGSCELGADPGPSQASILPGSCCAGLGHCLPAVVMREDERRQLNADICQGAETLCVPDAFAASDFRPMPCTLSSTRTEGRCLPDCLPQVGEQRDRLARDGCAEHHLCAPCADPLTGASTGACELGADPGPGGSPAVLDTCCGGRARCVPQGAVPEQQRGQLERETCHADGTLCVPTELVSNPNAAPATCVVSGLQSEGRCLSTCLPAVAARPNLFAQDGCADGQACVPCFDPVVGDATGACGFGNDPGPAQPAVVLAQCCGGLGRCTPKALVPMQQVGSLGMDSCPPDADLLCVAPAAALTEFNFAPLLCHDMSTGAEGRCLPACLPPVATLAAFLSRDVCPDANLCTPCFHPITGAETGACELGSDPGPVEPPVLFEPCCGASIQSATGLCVPASLLPEGMPELPQQSCSTAGSVCAPHAQVVDPSAPFPSCTSVGTDKGVCIEMCYLNSVAQLASFVGSCAAGSLCVSCQFLGPSIGGCAE